MIAGGRKRCLKGAYSGGMTEKKALWGYFGQMKSVPDDFLVSATVAFGTISQRRTKADERNLDYPATA